MSQALKATFSGFTKEQQRLGIPKGKTTSCFLLSLVPVNVFIWKLKLQHQPSKNTSVCHISGAHICSSFTFRLSSEDSEKAPLRKTDWKGNAQLFQKWRCIIYIQSRQTDWLQHPKNWDTETDSKEMALKTEAITATHVIYKIWFFFSFSLQLWFTVTSASHFAVGY